MLHFSFCGMQRSGNHAIIEWLLNHFNYYSHRNNILGFHYTDKPAQIYEQISDNNTVECHIDSWENYYPGRIQTLKKEHDNFFSFSSSSSSDSSFTTSIFPLIVILRDPYNWWASYYRFPILNPNVLNQPREYAITKYIAHAEYIKKSTKKIYNNYISYNKWVNNYDYRREIEERYGLKKSDVGMNKVSETSKFGSTFDRFAYQNKANKMKIEERWKKVIGDWRYTEALALYKEKLADISRELCDFEPPKELL